MTTGGGLYLVAGIGTSMCAIPIEHVSETMRPLPIDRLEGMPPFLLGLAIIRGRPVPVVDAARLVGIAAGPPARFVALKLGARLAALATTTVVGLRALAPGSLAASAPLLGEAGAELVTAVGLLDAALLLVLGGARLVPDSVWLALEARGSP